MARGGCRSRSNPHLSSREAHWTHAYGGDRGRRWWTWQEGNWPEWCGYAPALSDRSRRPPVSHKPQAIIISSEPKIKPEISTEEGSDADFDREL